MAMSTHALQGLLDKVSGLRVGVIGDFCLDVYWHADMQKSELSRETPHFPLPIVRERMQPGAAGNVACNLAALEPAQVKAFTVIGKDWRGAVLKGLLEERGIETAHAVEAGECVTNAYIKPLRKGLTDVVYEDPRLDFENHQPLAQEAEQALLHRLNQEAESLDLLYVCDQLRFGCVTPRIRQRVVELGQQGLRVFVDSRDRIGEYTHAILKPNEVELCRALGVSLTQEEEILRDCAAKLERETRRPVLVTLGAKGALVMEGGQAQLVKAIPVEPPLDICGAGDTFGAAAALFYAAGASLPEAAHAAACSASLTVKKLEMTGVTTRQELLERAGEVWGMGEG